MTNFDEADTTLLRLLQKDARVSNRALADAVGLAPSTCLERVRALHTSGVITGHHTSVDLVALNRPLQAMVAVRLIPKTKDSIERFVAHVWELPETIAVYLLSGTDDVSIHLAVPDTQRLRAVVVDDIASFPGVVDERSSLIYEHRRKEVVEALAATTPAGAAGGVRRRRRP